MNDKTRLAWMKLLGAVLVACIVLFLAAVLITETSQHGFDPSLVLLLLPAAAIIVVLLLMIRHFGKGVKSGLPVHDELSQRMKERAGYLTLMASIYFVLGLMFYHGILVEDYGFPGLVVRHAMMVTMIFMLCAFGIAWLTLSRKGIK